MTDVFLGLGSNVGDRVGNIDAAVRSLVGRDDIEEVALSSLYETKPVGYLEQPDFINAVVWVRTTLSAHELLRVTKGVEHELKRERGVRYGPRTIDVDILVFGDETMNEPHLRIPHPDIPERAFVLVPLVELAPEFMHPGGSSFAELLLRLPGEEVAMAVRTYRKRDS